MEQWLQFIARCTNALHLQDNAHHGQWKTDLAVIQTFIKFSNKSNLTNLHSLKLQGLLHLQLHLSAKHVLPNVHPRCNKWLLVQKTLRADLVNCRRVDVTLRSSYKVSPGITITDCIDSLIDSFIHSNL